MVYARTMVAHSNTSILKYVLFQKKNDPRTERNDPSRVREPPWPPPSERKRRARSPTVSPGDPRQGVHLSLSLIAIHILRLCQPCRMDSLFLKNRGGEKKQIIMYHVTVRFDIHILPVCQPCRMDFHFLRKAC